MNYKAFKFLSIFTAILFVISCSLTTVGFITHKNHQENKPNEKDNNETVENKKIQYKYYLEGVEVDEMPSNKVSDTNATTEEKVEYRFDEYKCTEGVTGIFDTDEWTFTPNKDIDAVCELYFNKAKYEVKLTVIKGTPDESNNYFVERFKDGEFKITPDDGYEYSNIQCSNDKVASYDKSKNLLKISAVSSDIACKVTFVQKKLSFELEVKNGKCEDSCVSGKIKSEGYYGDSISYIIYPQDRYEFVKGNIKCDNNQVADYSSNNFSIASLTSSTKCTLTFTKADVQKYKISITNSENETIKERFIISQGSDEIEVEEGGTGVINITIREGVDYIPKLNCPTRIPERSENLATSNEYSFTWMNVNQNIKCEIDSEPKPLE